MTTESQTSPFTAAAAIRFTRERRDLSARQLSMQAGCGEAYVGRIESGSLEPSLRRFARIAAALGFTDAEIAVIVRNEALQPLAAG